MTLVIELNMSKTTTIIPIYQPHFGYGINLLDSFREHSSDDIFFVFSNSEEARVFSTLTDKKYDSIILDQELVNSGSIITVKKLFGLKEIFERYDYIGVLDSEIKFVRNIDTDIVYKEIFDSKILKVNNSLKGGEVIKNTAEKMKLINNEILIQETNNFSQYWWFNEIHVYEKNTFFRFYEYLSKLDNYHEIMNDWWCFDFILYGIWLITNEGFKTKNMMPETTFEWGALEHNNSNEVSNKFNSHLDHNMKIDTNNNNNTKIIIQLNYPHF